MYDDEYQAMLAAEEAAENARKAAREAELAAGRAPSPEPAADNDQPLATIHEAAIDSEAPPSESAAPLALQNSSPPIPSSRPPDLSRHSRHCSICSHLDRDAIEAEFIRWRSPEKIAKDYDIPGRSCIYRHAHATGLFPARKRHISRVLESFLELVDDNPPEDFDPVTRAVRAYAHLDDDGKWFEPDRTLRILTGPLAVASRVVTVTALPTENANPRREDIHPDAPGAPHA